ncbi:MAG: 4-hydroxy-tetrahydrodipicolinate reductase [Clostridia bacterium]|nr:4-hydroxy-tetrahydrodipicolinate reductase [Clostridia bacterium]
MGSQTEGVNKVESNNGIKVVVTGACGKVGREMVKAVVDAPDMELVGAVDRLRLREDIGEVLGLGKQQVLVTDSLEEVLVRKPDVIIDFTNARAAFQHITTAVKHGVSVVSGSTGLSNQELEQIYMLCEKNQIGAVIAPNFALGAVLMFRLSQEVAKWFDQAEIIELHNDRKLDAPSGTALRTASLIQEQWKNIDRSEDSLNTSNVAARGDQAHGLSIHSVRLPGLVAHQEVIFGGFGQTLTIRHDSFTRESFVPGVMLSVRKVKSLKGVVFGLENLIF